MEARALTTSTLAPTAAATQALVTGGMSVTHCSIGWAMADCECELEEERPSEEKTTRSLESHATRHDLHTGGVMKGDPQSEERQRNVAENEATFPSSPLSLSPVNFLQRMSPQTLQTACPPVPPLISPLCTA